jgi:hypothetical protein
MTWKKDYDDASVQYNNLYTNHKKDMTGAVQDSYMCKLICTKIDYCLKQYTQLLNELPKEFKSRHTTIVKRLSTLNRYRLMVKGEEHTLEFKEDSKKFEEENPSIFFDKMCLDLIKRYVLFKRGKGEDRLDTLIDRYNSLKLIKETLSKRLHVVKCDRAEIIDTNHAELVFLRSGGCK